MHSKYITNNRFIKSDGCWGNINYSQRINHTHIISTMACLWQINQITPDKMHSEIAKNVGKFI